MKKLGLLLVAVLMVVATTLGNMTSVAAKTASKQVFNLQSQGELLTLDPAQATEGVSLVAITNTVEGIYRLNSKSQPQPALAKSVAKPSADGLHYTIKLRKNVKWSNNTPVTAKDVVYGWRRVVDPKTAAPYAYLFDGIKNATAIQEGKADPETLGVSALDDYTLQIDLERPIPYLDVLLAFPTFFPQNEAYVKEQGKKFGTSANNVLASGPYVLKGWSGTQQKWQMVKNKKYWDKKNVKMQTINVRVVKQVSTALNLFQTGKLDDIVLTGAIARSNKNNKDVVMRKGSSTKYLVPNFNQTLKDEKLRLAISQVIDRKSLAKNVLGDGSIASIGLIPQGLMSNPKTGQDFAKQAGKGVYTDVKNAKKLWKEYRATNKQPVTLTLLTSDEDTDKATAEYIQSAIESKLKGIKVDVQAVPDKVVQQRAKNGEFDLYLANWGADYPDAISFLDMFIPGSSFNYGQYNDATYTDLIKKAKITDAADTQLRYQDLLEAEKLLMKQQGVIPLYQRAVMHLNNKKIKGIIYYPTGSHFDYKYVEKKN